MIRKKCSTVTLTVALTVTLTVTVAHTQVIHVSPRKNVSYKISNDCYNKDPAPPPMSVSLPYISGTDLSWLFDARLTFLNFLSDPGPIIVYAC